MIIRWMDAIGERADAATGALGEILQSAPVPGSSAPPVALLGRDPRPAPRAATRPLTPRVSFLLPVRDGADTLEVALRSVLAQTDPDFEVVVVDELIALMRSSRPDHTLTSRRLADAARGDTAAFVAAFAEQVRAVAWLARWRARLALAGPPAERAAAMDRVNPRSEPSYRRRGRTSSPDTASWLRRPAYGVGVDPPGGEALSFGWEVRLGSAPPCVLSYRPTVHRGRVRVDGRVRADR